MTAPLATAFPSTPFIAGLFHPLLGPDHWIAMLAIGWLASELPRRLAWLPPATFVLTSLAGGVLALMAPALPGGEAAIAASLMLLGVAVSTCPAVARTGRVWIACGLALCGLFHGYVHAIEGRYDRGFFEGFIFTTALLHALGYGLGRLLSPHLRWTRRPLGAGVTLYGLALLSGIVS